MIFKLYHAMTRETRFEHEPQNFIQKHGDYKHIANIDCDTLDQAYELTQNVDHPWGGNAEVRVLSLDSMRSTSVGDVFVDNAGNSFMVAPAGFTKI